MHVVIEQFRNAIRSAGLTPPDVIKADAKLHRFASNGKRGDDAGFYVLHDDGILAGHFGDWRSGQSQTWRADIGRKLTPFEDAAHRANVAAMQQEREAEKARQQVDAAAKAGAIWKAAQPATEDHPYLTRKGIKPYGARLHGDALVIPMPDSGELQSLQFIGGDGEKRFLTGGRVSGCYCSIGNPRGATALCIVEGFATGATIHEATGYPVAVAFNAGNLLLVANAMRKLFAELPIIVCADDDYRTDGNPGLTKATEAALSVGGKLAIPDFGTDRPDGATDFNDMAAHRGREAVGSAIADASAPDVSTHQATTPDATAGDVASREPDGATIARLAALSLLEYDRILKAEASTLGVRPGTLDKLVVAARKQDDDGGMDFMDVEPWQHSVNAAALLTEISATVRRFIICRPETADAIALWVTMTWFMDVVQIAPLAIITAPEKRCGKSLLLSILGKLAYRPLTASSISPAAMFRAMDAWKPTLLIDEADSFMRDNEELRGIVNAGHTRDSAYVVRTVGEDFTPHKFSVWGAKALAGIGHLADTLMDRAIVLELRRKLPHENVSRLRHAGTGIFDELAEKLVRFADDHREDVRRARPDLPPSLNDRAQDNWEPLLAIADVAGAAWPELGRRAALKLSGSDSPTMSTGTELLADIKEVFELKRVDRISTADLIAALCDDEERPWATFSRGKPISPRQVSSRLAGFDVRSNTIRIGLNTPKGFLREQFDESFSRYLTVFPVTSATPPQLNADAVLRVVDDPQRCGNENASATPRSSIGAGCGGVADKRGEARKVDANGKDEVF